MRLTLSKLPTLTNLFSLRKTVVYNPRMLARETQDSLIKTQGFWSLSIPTVEGGDAIGWSVVCWPMLFETLRNRALLGGSTQLALAPLPATAHAHAELQVQQSFQASYCPPGSLYRAINQAPYSRLLQHIPSSYLEDPDAILIMRAGGMRSPSGREKLERNTTRLNQALRSLNDYTINKDLPPLYALLHCALRYSASE